MTRKKTTTETKAAKPATDERAELIDQMRRLAFLQARQNELLEGIFAATARMMLITDSENRKAGELRVVKDTHDLRRRVERLASADTVLRDLITTTDGAGNEQENSGNPLPSASGDH